MAYVYDMFFNLRYITKVCSILEFAIINVYQMLYEEMKEYYTGKRLKVFYLTFFYILEVLAILLIFMKRQHMS